MIKRNYEIRTLRQLLKENRIVGITGARQVGKTTVSRMLVDQWKQPVTMFDLEDTRDLARLQDPMLALQGKKGLIVLDEVQRHPGIFETLRVLADRPRGSTRFLVLGSASPEMLKQSSETLAGRIAYHSLGGFSLDEVGVQNLSKLWLRGGFPRSFLATSNRGSFQWRQNFIRTFLERDVPQLGFRVSSTTLQRFWSMLAHYHGQTWNASEFGRSFGVADTTVRNYLDLLSSTLVIRLLKPWYENISKRQVKAPKIYIVDSGLLHALLNLRSETDLEGHPKVGASWEGFALSQVVRQLGADPAECYFWATHSGAELDLLIVRGRQRFGFEFKRTSSPGISPSMRSALKDLRLSRLDVIYPGEETYPMGDKIRAVPLRNILTDIKPLR